MLKNIRDGSVALILTICAFNHGSMISINGLDHLKGSWQIEFRRDIIDDLLVMISIANEGTRAESNKPFRQCFLSCDLPGMNES